MHIKYNTYKPEFCYIAPTNYLQYTTASTSHLVLAHMVEKDFEYASFYKRRSTEYDFVIMDNSAYELKEPYSPDKLLALAELCGAHAIVLPDYPFKPSSITIEAAEKYIPLFKDAGYKTFFVPQSSHGNLQDWIDGYVWAVSNPDIDIIGMSILGVPNALPHVNPAYARVVMTALLQDQELFNSAKHHHYLGLNAGPALEIPSLIKMKALDTIDSSGPIWSAILGHQYTIDSDSYQTVKKLKMPVQFDYALTKDTDTLNRIEHNINLTSKLFEISTVESVWYAQE